MPLIPLLALAIAVSEPRIPAGGPGGNMRDAAIIIQSDRATTKLRVTLDAPPPTPLLSTGFPYTEGTRLWSLEADGSTLDMRYLFPIRGTYALTVAETHVDGSHATVVKHVYVPEDPRVLRTLALFVLGLLAAGGIAGYLLAGGLALPAVAPHVTLLVLFAALCGSATAMAPMSGPSAAGPKAGSLWPVVANVAGPATFDVQARNIEDGKPLFHVALPARDGRLRLRLQFYDGAPHELRVRAMRGSALLREWTQPIAVEAQSPPLGRRLWVLFTMLLIVAGGYAAGTATRLRTSARR